MTCKLSKGNVRTHTRREVQWHGKRKQQYHFISRNLFYGLLSSSSSLSLYFFYLEYFLVNKYAIYVKRASYTDTHNTHKRRNNTTGYIILEIWLWQVVFFSFFPLCLQNTCVCVCAHLIWYGFCTTAFSYTTPVVIIKHNGTENNLLLQGRWCTNEYLGCFLTLIQKSSFRSL